LTPSTRVRGFWDLPEPTPGIAVGDKLGEFRHTITHRHYKFAVREGIAGKTAGKPHRWLALNKLHEIPLSTTAKKALHTASIAP
jgi:adenine-specific DNA glycosylase